MKTRSLIDKPIVLFLAILLLSMFLINGLAISADTSKKKTTNKTKIQITSNHMKAVSKSKYAEFSGNVKAVQGDFILTSDVLRIYYSEGSASEKKPVQKGSVSKIVAKGNVHITSEDFTAVSNIALYLTEPMILILKGPNSTITSGENSIVGSKITYYRSDGRVKIEGTTDQRVVAVFYSKKDEKGDYSILPTATDDEDIPSEPGKPVVEKDIKE